MFNRNHVLHRDSSSGVPELLSGPIDTRRGKSAEGISHSSGDPLWRGATIRTAIESTGLTIRGNANIFLPFSFAFSFSLRILFVFARFAKGIVELSLFQNFFAIYSSFVSFSIFKLWRKFIFERL